MAHRKVNKHFFIREIVEKQSPYDYEIYVDASFRKDENNNSPFSAYSFVVTSNNTINEIYASRRLGKPGNSEKAETVGIYNVLDYIKGNKKFRDKKIIIYCDCINAVNSINKKISISYITVEHRNRGTKYIKIADKIAKTITAKKSYEKKSNQKLASMGINKKVELINKSIYNYKQ